MSAEFAGAWRLLLAAIFGALLGLERSIAGKHAGMRTYALVSAGSALFVVVGALASIQFSGFSGLDPLRIAGSIVLGIGFIGTGLAFLRTSSLDGSETPGELTTASGIWVAAGIGMACGFGLYILALCATVLAIIIFTFLIRLENAVRKKYGRELAR